MGDRYKEWGRCGMPCGLRDSVLWPVKAGREAFRAVERLNHRCLLKEYHPGPCEFITTCAK